MTAVGLKPSTATLREHLQSLLERDGDGTFTADERAMIGNILRLRETRVEDVMVQRAGILAVAADITLADLLKAFQSSGHSRMPVYAETLDDASGMVHIRDLMARLTEEAMDGPDLRLDRIDLSRRLSDVGLIRSVLFAPPSMPAADLLARMQSSRIQIALVIDEFGGVDGLVSLEDLVEIVVGEIEDEHDIEEEGEGIVATGEGAWTVDGLAELDDVATATGIDLAAADPSEDVDTVGGLVVALAGRIPAAGEQLASPDLPGVAFEVLAADRRRVLKIRLTRDAAEGGLGVGAAGAA